MGYAFCNLVATDLVICWMDFNGNIGRHIDGVHGRYGVGQRNLEVRMLLVFCVEKELCVSNTWFKREEERTVTFRMGGNVSKIEFVLIKK